MDGTKTVVAVALAVALGACGDVEPDDVRDYSEAGDEMCFDEAAVWCACELQWVASSDVAGVMQSWRCFDLYCEPCNEVVFPVGWVSDPDYVMEQDAEGRPVAVGPTRFPCDLPMTAEVADSCWRNR